MAAWTVSAPRLRRLPALRALKIDGTYFPARQVRDVGAAPLCAAVEELALIRCAVGTRELRYSMPSIEPLSRAFLCSRGDACGQMSASTRPAPKSPTESRSQTQGLVVASGTGSMLPVKAFQHGHVSRIGGPHIPGWMK